MVLESPTALTRFSSTSLTCCLLTPLTPANLASSNTLTSHSSIVDLFLVPRLQPRVATAARKDRQVGFVDRRTRDCNSATPRKILRTRGSSLAKHAKAQSHLPIHCQRTPVRASRLVVTQSIATTLALSQRHTTPPNSKLGSPLLCDNHKHRSLRPSGNAPTPLLHTRAYQQDGGIRACPNLWDDL